MIFAERWQARTGAIDDAEPGSGSGSGSGSGATKKELASLRAELKQETSFIQELVVSPVSLCLLASLCLLLCFGSRLEPRAESVRVVGVAAQGNMVTQQKCYYLLQKLMMHPESHELFSSFDSDGDGAQTPPLTILAS